MKRDVKADLRRALRAFANAFPEERALAEGFIERLNVQRSIDFDAHASKEAAHEGIARAKKSRIIPYLNACILAERIARERGEVHMDDVFRLAGSLNIDLRDIGPAAGGVFRDRKKWEFVRWTKSDRVSNHDSDLRVWRLRKEWLDANPIIIAA
jgi:hypothetical protein